MEQKRTRKFFRNLLTLALAGAMCLSATVTSFADEDDRDPDVIWAADEENGAVAVLSKVLKMPEGTTTPEVEFTFTFEKKEYNESTVQTELDKMPDITGKDPAAATGTVKIAFEEDDEGKTSTEGIKKVVLESEELTDLAGFTQVGVYKYEVTEVEDKDFIYEKKTDVVIEGNTFRENMDYSKAKYTITFWVKEKSNGSGVYVYAIAVHRILEDDAKDASTEIDGKTVYPKVDPTPGGNPSVEDDYSKMAFTNVFHRVKSNVDPDDPTKPEDPTTAPEDPTDPTKLSLQSLLISKTVTGTLGEQNKYFSFDVTIQQPATLTSTVKYHAYIVNNTTNAVVTSENHVAMSDIKTDAKNYDYFEVTAGTPKTINLKHNERIVFSNLHVGAKYTVTEAAAAGYTPSLVVVKNSETPKSETGELNTALSTADITINGANGAILIGEKANSAVYTNDYKDVPITGVIVNNLPFILLIAAAVGGFAFFVVVKYRKRENTEN